MTRVKRGVISMKRRRNILKQVKGFRHGTKIQRKNGQRSSASRRIARFPRQEKEKEKYESLVASKNKRRLQNQRDVLQQIDK